MGTQRASHHPIFTRTPAPCSLFPKASAPSLPSAQSKWDTHIGPSQAAELVLQVAGEVVSFLDGGARPWISCAIKSWHCREVPQHRA